MKELKGKKRDGGSERWHKDLNVDFMLLPVSVRVSVGVEGVQCWEDFGETADGWELGAGWGGGLMGGSWRSCVRKNKLRSRWGCKKGRRYCTHMKETMYIYSNAASPEHWFDVCETDLNDFARLFLLRWSRQEQLVVAERMLLSLQLTPGLREQ